MNFSEAQQDMRRAYYDGATGVIVSATVWSAPPERHRGAADWVFLKAKNGSRAAF